MRSFTARLIALAIVVIAALVLVPVALAQSGSVESAEDLAAWASITGILLPLLIAVVVRYGWSAQTKMLAAAAFAIVDGVVVTGLTHGWHFDGHLLATVSAVLVISQTTYRNVWTKLGDSTTPPGEPGPDTQPPGENFIAKLSRATG